jgi:calcineurin-like phosphoesterase family protein
VKKIWVLGDTHFGHNSLVSEGLRPADYEARLVRNALRSTKEGDDLVHLGDLSLYAPGELAAHQFISSVRRQIGDRVASY